MLLFYMLPVVTKFEIPKLALVSILCIGLGLAGCAEKNSDAESSSYEGKGFFRRAVLFSISDPDNKESRCWYGSVVGSYRSREFALQESSGLNSYAIKDSELKSGAEQLDAEATLRQLASATFCVTAGSSTMGLAAPICVLGLVNSWQAWGEKDALEASNKNLSASSAKTVTDWSFDQVVGLQKIVSYAAENKRAGTPCPNTPAQDVVRFIVNPSKSGSSSSSMAAVCDKYRVKSGTVAKMWTGPSGSGAGNYGVGANARIQLAQSKSQVGNNSRIWGKVLDGTQAGDSAWFARADLVCEN